MSTSIDHTSVESFFQISGMSCGACVGRVERAVRDVQGVEAVAVDLGEKRAAVRGTASVQAIVDAVADAGYEARPIDPPSGSAA